MFTGIYHVGDITDDLAATIAFYESLFGATIIGQGNSADGTSKLAFLKVGNTEIDLIEAPERVRQRGAGSIVLDHIGYLVPDIEAAAAELRAKGIRFAAAAPNLNPLGHKVLYLDLESTHGFRMHLTER